jgi:2'-5' RNA ligase
LFFALWPNPALQSTLVDAARNVITAAGGRPVLPQSLHVTLAFLGAVPEADLGKVEAIGAEVASTAERAPVQFAFNAIEYWKKPQVLCATAPVPTAGTSLADALATKLKSRLVAAGFTPDLKPFRAHVTLMRKVPRGTYDCALQPVTWSFVDFALVGSRPGQGGSSYSVLNSWPLCTEVRKMPEKKHK